MAKKKYNPFKMWGSYVGALMSYLFFAYVGSEISATTSFTTLLNPMNLFQGSGEGKLFVIIGLIIGFLIGWGIHSLIRKLK